MASEIEVTRIHIKNVEDGLKLYAIHHDAKYPDSSAGFQPLQAKPADDSQWNGPYLADSAVLTDAWGSPLVYRYPGMHGADRKPEIRSIGPDKKLDTADDLTN